MPTCFYCKTKETALYQNGVAICLTCVGARPIQRKPTAPELEDIRAKLHRDWTRATDRKEMAIAHHRLNDFLARGIVPDDLKRSG